MGRLHRLSFISVLIGHAFAQVTYPNCSAGWEWSYNSLNQNPCNVAASLAASCNAGEFNIPPLPPGGQYAGPPAGKATSCKCNTISYSLLSACAACQGSSWILWSSWSINCTTVAQPSTYPNPIPDGTRVPYWAYIDVETTNTWSVAAAQSAGDSPEATPTTSSTTQPSSTASSSPDLKPHKSHSGKIAGAVVGSIAGVALLIASIVWYLRRRRWLAEPQPSPFGVSEPNIVSEPIGKLYDPSDPSTFPVPFVASSATVTQITSSGERLNPMSSQDRNPNQYSGLPLV